MLKLTFYARQDSDDAATAIRLLLDNGDPSLYNSFLWAVRASNIAAVKLLLGAGADPSHTIVLHPDDNACRKEVTPISEAEEQIKHHKNEKVYHTYRLNRYCKHAERCKDKRGSEMHKDHLASWWRTACEDHKRSSVAVDQRISDAEAVCAFLKARIQTAQTNS